MYHTHTFNGPFAGLPGWAGTRKVKPILILLKKETVSGNGISWAICKPAPRSRQITTPAPHRSVFYRPDALPAAQPTASKHWRQCIHICLHIKRCFVNTYAYPDVRAYNKMSLVDVVAGIHCSELRHQFSPGRPSNQGYLTVHNTANHSLGGNYVAFKC